MRIENAGLSVGGVAATELARAYGTPLLAIDTDELDANVAALRAAAAPHGFDICYASKALLFVALARRLADAGIGLDVCSLGELLTVERANVESARIVMHGCGKTDAELDAVCAGRVGRIVVDNEHELGRLAARADAARPIDVLLRLNTGIATETHAYVRTAGEDSKFGFASEALDDAAGVALGTPGLRLVGIHSHLGSQLFDAGPYVASVSVLMDAFARMLSRAASVRQIVVGGGFGVDSSAESRRMDLPAAFAAIAGAVAHDAAQRKIDAPRIGIEPGRSVVASAGTSLYGVVAVKRHGGRRFAIVDGGIADNPRPALYGAYHHPMLAGRSSTAAAAEFTVCGRSCENDRLVVAKLPADVRPGDLLALSTTGAYTYSMASNYNRFPKPAVAFAGAGRHRLVVRRENDADTLRNDVVAAE